MGHFRVRIEIAEAKGERFHPVDALVDTGSTYTVVPRPILESLGIVPAFREPFELADGTVVERDVAEVLVRIDGRVLHTLCVFEEPGTEPLVGVYTLEGFGLTVDPIHHKLRPMRARL